MAKAVNGQLYHVQSIITLFLVERHKMTFLLQDNAHNFPMTEEQQGLILYTKRKSATMIKFLSLDFLGVSPRIL